MAARLWLQMIFTTILCTAFLNAVNTVHLRGQTLATSRRITQLDSLSKITMDDLSEMEHRNYSDKVASDIPLPTLNNSTRGNFFWSKVNRLPERRKRDVNSANVVITQHFIEKIITPGEDVSLQCTASGVRPPRFKWERDSMLITPNTDERYTLIQMMSSGGEDVVSQLNITRSRVEDGGMYSCTAVDGDFTVSHQARLDVYGPPYIRNMPPIKVLHMEPLKLRCPYYGYPISKLEWEHNGKRIASTTVYQRTRYKRQYQNPHKRRRRQIYQASEEGVLSVHKLIKDEDSDSYVCIVYSPSGEMARRSFEIQIVQPPELDELRLGTGLKEGQIVQITCNIVSGDAPIYFSWLKDGKKVPPNLKITERSSALFSVLIIKKASLEHCGTYTCIATNHVGKAEQTADLYINVPPKWLEEPTNTSVLMSQRGVVFCNANGYPTPQIRWMKRDDALGIWRPLLDLAGGGITSFSNGTLIIEVVSIADEGVYSCHVENGIGEPLNKNIWITVNKPVHFESSTTELTTKIGFPVQLICQPLGDHPIRIKWTVDGKPLDFTSSRVKITEATSENGLKSTIDINYAETSDAGQYQCRASNPYGVLVYTIQLSILEPPSPPTDLQVESVSSRTIQLTWRDVSTNTQFYTIQYSNNEYTPWDAAVTVNITRHDRVLRENYEMRELQVENLLPYTEYKVRVCAGNQAGLSDYTPPVHLTTQPEVPSSPPLTILVQNTDNPGELTVNWSPPSRETHNGVLQGYHVKVEPSVNVDTDTDDKTRLVKVSSRKGKQETTISGLLKNTRYAVSVSAFNAAGNGPYSLIVYQTTRPGAPEVSPMSVECTAVSSTSVRVAWQPLPVRTQGGALMGYTVTYGTDDESWQNVTSPHTELYLQALMKYSNYSIKVAGYSNYGVGPFSYPIVCTTLQDVPSSPSAFKLLVSSSTSLLVSWNKPEQANGIITHYTVYAKHASSANTPKAYRVEPPQESNQATRHPSFELKELTEKQYEVCVSASTEVGEGTKTNVLIRELTNKVVAGIASFGGLISVGVGWSLLLVCRSVGFPPPRTVWYYNTNMVTHHPRYTTNHDDSLLINNIDQTLSGNYTCLAKNLYGSDTISYIVKVIPAPDVTLLRALPYKDSIKVEWNQPYQGNGNRSRQKISYHLTWKESTGIWQGPWSTKATSMYGVMQHTLTGLKCGTKYSVRMIAANSIGSSPPAYLDVSTLGGVPIPPSTVEWLWSNATHIYIQLNGWHDNGCPITKWDIEYCEYDTYRWRRAENTILPTLNWASYSDALQTTTFAIADLIPAQWYKIRVTATNAAGGVSSVYNFATTTELGEAIAPPSSDILDINMLVIICSSVLLTVCFISCIYILVKRHRQSHQTEYRNSLTADCKSESGNITADLPQNTASAKDYGRVYSAPIHMQDPKHELYEISPYAHFALGFRTFGHVDNQEPPSRPQPGGSARRYDSETSFQMRSESEESDCVSRTTTLKSVPRKACRVPHHR